LQQELCRLRSVLEKELSHMSWRDVARRPATSSAVYSRLGKLGLSKTLSGSLVDRLPAGAGLDAQWSKAMSLLAAQLRVQPEMLGDGNNILAVVGSTGVGKTTTVAKLAARYVMRFGGREVALVTTDRYRIGGKEQLESMAGYLGVPVKVANDGEQLRAALDKLASRRVVLVDTAGMSQRDMRLYEQFTTLQSVGRRIAIHAVLSATTQPALLSEVIRVFGAANLAGAVITKIDEAVNLGGVLDAVIRNKLPLSFMGTGQRIPEDIVPASASFLVDKAVELSQSTRNQGAGTLASGRLAV